METFVIHALIGFWLVFFSAMAIFPLVTESKPARSPSLDLVDDLIISIQPDADFPSSRQPLTSLATVSSREPDRREAA